MRRFWMLLLVMVAMIAVMAFPAMASETCTCDGTHLEADGWLKLDDQTVDTLVDGGKYYVDGGDTGILAKYLIITGVDKMNITICLNGKVWTGEENYNSTGYPMRPLTLSDSEGSVTVNIVDCSAESTGALQGVDYGDKSGSSGGAAYVSNGNTLNLFSGNIIGGKAVNGGSVYVTGETEFNMHGGVIKDGTASDKGGNIYLTSNTSVMNFIGGTIQDGTAKTGGNLHMANGKFNMGTQGDTSVTSPAISGGENTSGNGGSLNVAKGTFKMMSGVVSGGKSANAGSNIYVSGTLEMTGGLFTNPNKSGGNQNVFIVGGTLKMSGGEIAGNISATNSAPTANSAGCVLQVSGSAKITGNGISLGWWRDSNKYTTEQLFDSPRFVVNGAFNDDAQIVINNVSECESRDTVAVGPTESDWAAYEAYAHGDNPVFVGVSGKSVVYSDIGLELRTGDWDCYCGYHGDKHLLGCCVDAVQWKEWTGGSIDTSGNYRLKADTTKTSQIVFRKYDTAYNADGVVDNTTYTKSDETTAKWRAYAELDVVIDLNGHNITFTGTRGLQSWYGASVTICNSKVDEDGKRLNGVIAACGQTTADNYQVWQMLSSDNVLTDYSTGSKVERARQHWDEEFAILDGVTLKFDRSLNATTNVAKSCGVLEVNNAVFNMYGGTLIGDPDHELSGNAGVMSIATEGKVYVHPGSVIMAGKVYNQTANNSGYGSAIYISGGNAEFIADGATITAYHGDTLVGCGRNGGLIAVSNSTAVIEISNSTLVGASTINAGGVVRATSAKSISITDSTVTGGVNASGGFMYIGGATEVTLDNVDVTAPDGYKPAYGLIYLNHDSAEMNVTDCSFDASNVTCTTGGSVVYAKAGTINITGSELIGGTGARGAGIYGEGGTVNIEDSTLTAAQSTSAESGGAGISMKGGSLSLKNTDVIAHTTDAEGNVTYCGTANFNGGAIHATDSASVTIEGGKIYGGQVGNNGGAIYFSGSTMLIKGGAKIYGGEALYGGAVCVGGEAVVTVEDNCLISGGTAAEGGAVFIGETATFTLDGSIVENGTSTRDSLGADAKNTADDTNLNDGKGSNFYVLGTLTVQNSSIVRGGAVNVINSATSYDGDDGNDYGGSAFFIGQGGNVTVSDSTISGNTTSKMWKRAGTIYNYKGTITLTNSSVTASAVPTDSGLLYNRGGTVTITNSTLDASNLSDCEGLTGIAYGAAVRNTESGSVTMNSGTITGFKTGNTNGGAAVYNGANFYLKGGTIQGATTTNTGIGGAVANASSAKFEMSGGTIIGGEAFQGGAVYMTSGTFTMSGGTIRDGKAAQGGNIYVKAGTFQVTGADAIIQDGRAIYNSAGRSDTYAYGGNVYVNGGTFKMTGGTVSGGTSMGKTATSWAPAGNIYANAGTTDLKNATIIDGQNTEEALAYSGIDGNNLYVNYDSTVYLREGTVVENTANNNEVNVVVQGGKLYIYGASIINAKDVAGRNLVTNSSSLTNKSDGEYHFNYVNKGPYIEMTSGTISGANYNGSGANVILDVNSEFIMTGGTIENGQADNSGANIFTVHVVDTNAAIVAYNTAKGTSLTAKDWAAHVTIGGNAKIIGGSLTTAEKNGGSIFGGGNTTITIEGNAEVYGGSSKNCGGNIYTNGYLTIGGNAKVYNGKAKDGGSQTNVYAVSGHLTLQDNAWIPGGVGAHGKDGTVTLKGSPIVDASLTAADQQQPDYGLSLWSGATLILDGLTADAQVDLHAAVSATNYTVDEATKGYIISPVINDSVITGLTYETLDCFIRLSADNKVILVPASEIEGVVINGGKDGVQVYTFEEAIAALKDGDYITMLGDQDGVTINKSIMVDLNGANLTNLTLAEGVELKLFDAGTLDYKVEKDANSANGYSGYGTVTLSEDNKGTIARVGNTPKASYGGNYRYIVIKDEAGYHAHRIYITVKAIVLYPNRSAVNFRTILRCDQLVADYINAEGGGFGVVTTTSSGEAYGDYKANGIEALAWNSSTTEENSRVTRLNNVLKEGLSIADNTKRARTAVEAKAYIYLNDQFYDGSLGSDKATNLNLINQQAVFSSVKGSSLYDMVGVAYSLDPATLSESSRLALYGMYTQWTALMDSWKESLANLQFYIDTYGSSNMKYACVCGSTSYTNNPCAAAGHPSVVWTEWTGTTIPKTTGNYYLSGNITLTEQGSIPEGALINLNLNGHTITGANPDNIYGARIANVNGTLNITNFGFGGASVEDAAIISYGAKYRDTLTNGVVTGKTGGNGGNLLIGGTGNVSLYKGVTLKMAENHYAKNSVVEVGGDLNIYGGTIEGATMRDTYANINGEEVAVPSTIGGAVGVGAKGYLYINSGSITGGKAMYGGTIYNQGTVEIEGDAVITGGEANDGGMFYVKSGTVTVRGVDLDASAALARRGALAFIENGEVIVSGTAEKKATVTGGAVYTTFKTKVENEKTVKDGDSANNNHGSGGVFYMTDGKLDLDYCDITGGVTKQMNLAGTSIGNYYDDLDGHGGSVLYISGGEVKVDACDITGYNASMVNKRGGNMCIGGGTVVIDGDEAVEGTSTLKAGYSGINGNVVHITAGSFTMNEGTVLDASEFFAAHTDGVTYGGVLSLAGTKAIVNINGGTISGGVAKYTTTHGGGSVSMSSGTINMTGGTITGGVFKTGAATATAGGGNIRISGGTFNMTGGTITGGVDHTGMGGGLLCTGGNINISGTARIYDNYDTNGAQNNIHLTEGRTIKLGKLESGAKLGVTLATEGGVITSDNTENNQSALDNGWLVSDKGLDTCIGTDNQFYIGKYQCECGAANGAEHQEGCSGEYVLWTPWTNTAHLPNEAGHWYLAYEGDVTVTGQAEIGVDATADAQVFVDLNGKTVTRKDSANNNRFFAVMSSADYNHTLTISDTSSGKSGKLVCAPEGTGQSMGIWVADAGSTVKLLGGTIDASGVNATKYGGTAIYLEANTAVQMYGGTLIGGTTNKNGGTVYMKAGASFTMEDGKIIAGQALCTQAVDKQNQTKEVTIDGVKRTVTYNTYKSSSHGCGGAVFIEANATFILNDGSVEAPTNVQNYRSAGHGGMFYANGNLEIHGGTVKGGTTNPEGPVSGAGDFVHHDCGYGANIFVGTTGNMIMDGGRVEDGHAIGGLSAYGTYTVDGTSHTYTGLGGLGGGCGGNIGFSGEVSITGGVITGGEAATGGNIGTNNENGKITLGADGLAEKTVQILNGTAGSGGNLAINVRPCSSFVINDGTWIEGGHATASGGNICISPWVLSNSQYVQTGTDEDGKKVYATDYTATITMNGGTVTGGTANSYGGNIYIYGRQYTNTNTAYPKVTIVSTLVVGDDVVISDGAASNSGNNLYLNSYAHADIAGTIRNTRSFGDLISVGEESVTVSINSVQVGTQNSTLDLSGSILNEKAAGAQTQPVMRNLLANSGITNISGGTISGGYLTGAGDHGANLCINYAAANVTMTSGTITGGVVSGYTLYTEADQKANSKNVAGTFKSAAHGGNVYINEGSLTVSGGTIENGICKLATDTAASTNATASQVSGSGGNIYVTKGSLTLEGEALVTGGKVARGGGNIFAVAKTLTIRGNAKVTNGVSTLTNGGNIYAGGSTTVSLAENAEVSGGMSYDGGGNIYANGTFNMTGGHVFGGAGTARWSSYTDIYDSTSVKETTSADSHKNNANLFFVGSYNVSFSGGLVEGGVSFTNSTASPKAVKFSGTIRITDNGCQFGDYSAGEGKINPIDVTELQADGEVGIRVSNTTMGRLTEKANVFKLTCDTDDVAFTDKLVKECDPDMCQVAYLTAEEATAQGFGTEAGIYLLNGSIIRYNCICGANEDESHVGECDGTEVLWKAWTSKSSLPVEPGNWYLSYGTDRSNSYAVGTTSLYYDYYQDAEGEYVAVRGLMELNENGGVIQLENENYKQKVDASGNPVWLAGDGKSIATIPEGSQVLDAYEIRVDLNGYKLEGPSGNRSITYYSRTSVLASNSDEAGLTALGNVIDGNGKVHGHRQARATYTLTDSSEGHTAVMASYGRFTNNERTSINSPQGTVIWVYWQNDTLNTYRLTLDASNVKSGWGLAIATHGTANLYDTVVVGGTAQAYYGENTKSEIKDEEGNVIASGYVKTVGGSSVGGGAIHVVDTGTVNMFGGTIRDGIAVYRYMEGSNGVNSERSIGGGNVYVNGVFNVTGTEEYPAVIENGKALAYVGNEGDELSTYVTAQGGGVYLYEGTMTVNGNVIISGNYVGTVNGTEDDTDGSGNGRLILDENSIVLGAQSNVFLNGNILEANNLTGQVGFTMIGTEWQGTFAKVDNGSTAYTDNSKLVPDVAQTATHVVYEDGYLRYLAEAADTLQVGYGVASIQPTPNDIANGLPLGGYGNNSYSTSGERVRITRYWQNASSGALVATDANHALNGTTAPMQAVAMAFRDTEGDTVIIVNLDYNNVSAANGLKAKTLISRATGVSIDNITIAASHQHTGPTVNKQYWTDLNGNYTKSYEETHNGTTLLAAGASLSGTYAEILYGNEALKPWEERRVRTDYATTFYTGILDAAVQAYKDLAPVSSITAGIMDTTTGGDQYNYVRNVALYDSSDLTTIKGMITDNHTTHQSMRDSTAPGSSKSYYSYSTITSRFDISSLSNEIVQVGKSDDPYHISNMVQKPESELDVTMQIVKYERADKTIVLTNFQSHPHLADGSENLNPTGGVVYVFRKELSDLYGTQGKPCQVLYFSGGGGNVNSGAKITSDNTLQPWYEESQTSEYKALNTVQQKARMALSHGTTLAGLANAFIGNANAMSVAVNPAQANVQVSVVDFEYNVWNEKNTYTVGSYTVAETYSDIKVANAKLLYDGGYTSRPGDFTNTIGGYGENMSYWQYFVGNYSEKDDKIYSFFHAGGVTKRAAAYEEGGSSTGNFEIKAYDLGGIGFVAAPYEMFQESGQAIKGNVQATLQASQPTKYANFPNYVTNGCGYMVDRSTTGQTQPVSSPYAITIIASQATGARGYIPSVLGYVNGGYATDTTLFEPGTGEQLVTAYVDMLIGLHNNTK